MEPFAIVEETPDKQLFDKFQTLTAGLTADHDIQYQAALKQRFPDLTVTTIPTNNCNILSFAAAGHATAELDTSTDPVASWRGWVPSYGASGSGHLGQTVFFAKHILQWKSEHFILYSVDGVQYLLKEPASGESSSSPPKIVDQLIATVGTWQSSNTQVVWVYDRYWRMDPALFKSVQKASWDKVILDEDQKKDLVDIPTKFFDNEDVYKDLGVPWKRGLIFHGPAGNGKTVSIKALMHTLHQRDRPVPSLYVKAAPSTFDLGQVFSFARSCSPCMLVLEDLETIINPATRSYFLNEVDGLDSNDGILMVATTNFLERLDPGITKRPSRFDRLFLFPLPNTHERTLYAEYWRRKVLSKESKRIEIEFPERLCPAMAAITNDFSFAYMQEAFVASLLAIARDSVEQVDLDYSKETTFRTPYSRSPASQALYAALNPHDIRLRKEFDELDQYKLWRVFKDQVRILRNDMDNSSPNPAGSSSYSNAERMSATAPAPLSYDHTPFRPEPPSPTGSTYPLPSRPHHNPEFTAPAEHYNSAWQTRRRFSPQVPGQYAPLQPAVSTIEHPAFDLPAQGQLGSKWPQLNSAAKMWIAPPY
ncbi:P-loop containing nucleoside triphosphate hydrolase protein [Myriangium duriaei CBS 260.36]|uniref:P-loop containing nucleoside triphosphate hydrolase protein n=1 Tax=Myriangium duriaei CBS 260.36 TaxID=1168546 RepID=A0A9P4J8N2_9PEZI|nr:P-loop containing nucleoside triphosphate hydrolase protein [Myriangium duriaei CBS 260.36]